jgi:hypothetical protein
VLRFLHPDLQVTLIDDGEDWDAKRLGALAVCVV